MVGLSEAAPTNGDQRSEWTPASTHRRTSFRPVRRPRATSRSGASARSEHARASDARYIESIQAELVLLREENARLRFERVQRPDADSMIEHLKTLSAAQPPDEDDRDDAWHLIGEALVMREVLIDICKEIGQTSITLQTRLNELQPDLPQRDVPPAPQERRTVAAAADRLGAVGGGDDLPRSSASRPLRTTSFAPRGDSLRPGRDRGRHGRHRRAGAGGAPEPGIAGRHAGARARQRRWRSEHAGVGDQPAPRRRPVRPHHRRDDADGGHVRRRRSRESTRRWSCRARTGRRAGSRRRSRSPSSSCCGPSSASSGSASSTSTPSPVPRSD